MQERRGGKIVIGVMPENNLKKEEKEKEKQKERIINFNKPLDYFINPIK